MDYKDAIVPDNASSSKVNTGVSTGYSDNLVVEPQSLYFGAMVVGDDTLTRQFTVKNPTRKTIRVDNISLQSEDDNFELSGLYPPVLKPGESFEMSVTYNANELGFKSGIIAIETSKGDAVVGLSARVIASLYIEAMYNEFKASLLEEAWVRAEADFAEAGHRLLLEVKMGEDISAMAEILTTAYVDADTAVVTHMEEYIAERNFVNEEGLESTLTAEFLEFIQVTVDGENALGEKIQTLRVDADNIIDYIGDDLVTSNLEAYIKNREYVYVGDGESRAGTVEELFSNIETRLISDYTKTSSLTAYIKNVQYSYTDINGVSQAGTSQQVFSGIQTVVDGKLLGYTKTTDLTAYIKNVQYTYVDEDGISQSGTSQEVFSGIQETFDNKLEDYTKTINLTAYIKNVQYTYTDINGVSQAGTSQQVFSGIQSTVDSKLAGYTTTTNLTAYINNVQYTYTDINGTARTETRTEQVSRLQTEVSTKLSGKLNTTDLAASVKNITFTFTDATTGVARADQIEDLLAQVSQTVKDTKDDIPTTTEITAQINSHAYTYTDLEGVGRAETLVSLLARYNTDIGEKAAGEATAAVNTYNTALVDGTNAFGSRVNTIETKLDLKPVVLYQASIPTSTGRIQGDQWFDTDDNKKPYIWVTGTGWVDNTDGRLTNLISRVTTVEGSILTTEDVETTAENVVADYEVSVNTRFNDLNGNGLFKITSEAGSGSVASRIKLWVRATTSDSYEEAGMVIEAVDDGINPPYNRIVNSSDKMLFTGVGGVPFTPLVVDTPNNRVLLTNVFAQNIVADTIETNHLKVSSVTTSRLATNAGIVPVGTYSTTHVGPGTDTLSATIVMPYDGFIEITGFCAQVATSGDPYEYSDNQVWIGATKVSEVRNYVMAGASPGFGGSFIYSGGWSISPIFAYANVSAGTYVVHFNTVASSDIENWDRAMLVKGFPKTA